MKIINATLRSHKNCQSYVFTMKSPKLKEFIDELYDTGNDFPPFVYG